MAYRPGEYFANELVSQVMVLSMSTGMIWVVTEAEQRTAAEGHLAIVGARPANVAKQNSSRWLPSQQ